MIGALSVDSVLYDDSYRGASANGPSLGASRRGGPKQPGEDAIVDAMTEQLALYALQMNVPRRIIDGMMSIPPNRLRWLRPDDLGGYAITRADPGIVAQ